MKKSLRNLSLLGAMLLAGTTSSWAQYSAHFETGAVEGWTRQDFEFDAEQIATALNCDTTALFDLIDAGGNVYLELPDSTSNYYTGNANEFWMNSNGVSQGYGADGTSWWAGIYSNRTVEEGEKRTVIVGVGQMPGFFKKVYTDTDLKCKLVLIKDETAEGSVFFDVDWHVNASEKSENVTFIPDLNIVKEYEYTLNFNEGKQYENTVDSISVAGIYDALGLDKDSFDGATGTPDLVYAQTAIASEVSGSYVYSDSLTLINDGFDGWFGRYTAYDEDNDKEYTYTQNALRNWSAGCTTYIHTPVITTDEAGNEYFTLAFGQYSGTMSAGCNDSIYLYVVNGANAVKIKLALNVIAKPVVDPSDYTLVGEGSVNITRKKAGSGSYDQAEFSFDTTPITEALGCSFDDMTVYAWENYDAETKTYSNMSDNYTQAAATQGFFFGPDGTVKSWGSDAAFYIGITDFAAGTFYSGQMAGHYSDMTTDTTDVAHMLFVNAEGKYYDLTINYNVICANHGVEKSEWKVVATFPYDVQVVKSEGYSQTAKTQIATQAIADALGVEDLSTVDFYAYKPNENGYTEFVADSLTNNYSTSATGFWMSENGKYRGSWGSSAAYGLDIALPNGEFSWYVHPDTPNEAGATYQGEFFLVNSDNGNVAKLVFNVTYVDTRVEIETVGETKISIVCKDENMNDDGFYALSYDLTEVLKAIGFESIDELATASWYVQNELGSFSSTGSTDFEGENIGFNAKGNITDVEDDKVFSVGYDQNNNAFTVSLFGNDVTKNLIYTTRVALRNDDAGKQYIFKITLGEENAVGISGVSNDSNKLNGKIYDLNGRQLKNLQKGINIVNGKKVMVK